MLYVDGIRDYPDCGLSSTLWCHLATDSDVAELHQMAARLGLRRSWFRTKYLPHYALTPTKRALAVALGAREVQMRELVRLCTPALPVVAVPEQPVLLMYDVALWTWWPSLFPTVVDIVQAESAFLAVLHAMGKARMRYAVYTAAATPGQVTARFEYVSVILDAVVPASDESMSAEVD